jgi:predicted RNA-binding protein with PIN domain
MSIHYVLDGYNVLKQVTHLTGVKLRNDRMGLLWYLLERRPQGSPRNRVTVVFDGHDDPGKLTQAKPLRVVFGNTRSADDVIVSMIRRSRHPRSLIVVTDDREVRLRVKDAGASVLSVREFLAQGREEKPKKVPPGNDKPDPESHRGRTITDELERKWTDCQKL